MGNINPFRVPGLEVYGRKPIQLPATTNVERGPGKAGQFAWNEESKRFEGHDGERWGPLGGVGVVESWEVIHASRLMTPGQGYWVDTTGLTEEPTLRFPANPNKDDLVGFGDYRGDFSVRGVLLDTNGSRFMGEEGPFLLETDNMVVVCQYVDSTVGWKIISGAGLGGGFGGTGEDGGGGLAIETQPTQYGNGVETVFLAPHDKVVSATSFLVVVGGVVQTPYENFEILEPGRLVLGSAPDKGVPVSIRFFRSSQDTPIGDVSGTVIKLEGEAGYIPLPQAISSLRDAMRAVAVAHSVPFSMVAELAPGVLSNKLYFWDHESELTYRSEEPLNDVLVSVGPRGGETVEVTLASGSIMLRRIVPVDGAMIEAAAPQYGDGTTTVFTGPHNEVVNPATLWVVVGGVEQWPGVHYFVDEPGKVRLVGAPAVGTSVLVRLLRSNIAVPVGDVSTTMVKPEGSADYVTLAHAVSLTQTAMRTLAVVYGVSRSEVGLLKTGPLEDVLFLWDDVNGLPYRAPEGLTGNIDSIGTLGGSTVDIVVNGVSVTLKRARHDDGAHIDIQPLQVADGVSVDFVGPHATIANPENFLVEVNSVLQTPITDYEIVEAGKVRFKSPPTAGAEISIRFFRSSIGTPTGDVSKGMIKSRLGQGYRALEDITEDLLNVKSFGARGDGVTDDTTAFKLALSMLDTVVVPPGNYVISDTLEIGKDQTLRGSGPGSNLVFTYTDMLRDYLLIRSQRARIESLQITSTAEGDTYNSGAVVMRSGAVDAIVKDVVVQDCPATAYAMESTINCRMENIVTYRARRHGIYIIASTNPTVDGFTIYNNKLEPVVFRGFSDTVPTAGYRLLNGIIDGVHAETTAWNAITLARHPNNAQGTRYLYQDILVENVIVRSPFSTKGYGAFFSYNQEEFRYCSFINNSIHCNGESGAMDFRNGKFLTIKGNRVFNSRFASYIVDNCHDSEFKDNATYNPVLSADPNQAAVLVLGGSSEITFDGLNVHDNLGNCPFGLKALDTTSDIVVLNSRIVGCTNEVYFENPETCQYGTYVTTGLFTANNVAPGTAGALAQALGGSGHFIVPVKGFLHAMGVHINEIPTAGTATLQLRKNSTETIASLVIDSNSETSTMVNLQPMAKQLSAGDTLSVVYYSDANWDKPNSDFTINAVLMAK